MRTPLIIIVLLTFRVVCLAQITKPDSLRLQSLLKVSRADFTHKDYRVALKHLKLYAHVKDSMLETSGKRRAKQLQLQYQIAKKDQEIKSGERNINLLTKQNQLRNQNLQQVKVIRNIVLALAVVAALLLAISYYQYRLKQKTNLRLESQQVIINQKNEALQQLAGQKDDLLDEKELLIKEIHHRVKNNLQVVISLLNTQSAYLNDPQASAAIRQSQHRMQSISLIHQKLYQSESRALINMKDYTQELVQYLQQSFDTGTRIAFKLTVDDIDLDVLRAVPVGLILNEAITNAIKYAFPANADGCIEVTLSCIDGHLLRLSVTDNGIGLPPDFDIDLCQSLGINLMKGMCKQISAQLAIESKKGLLITLDFPTEILTDHRLNNDISPIDGGFKLATNSSNYINN